MSALLRGLAGLVILAIAALAVVLGWAKYTAEGGAAGSALPFATIAPETRDPSILDRIADPENQDLEAAWVIAKPLLREAPLSAQPFRIAALRALDVGDVDGAGRLFEIAYRRQPRDRAARLSRARGYLTAGDNEAGVRELERLIWLDPQRSQEYVGMLAMLAADPALAQVIETRMMANPQLRASLLYKLNEQHPDISRLIRLNVLEPNAQPGLVQRLLREAGLEAAFIGWIEFLPPEDRASLSWPYNPKLEEREIAPPFNWTVHTRLAEYQPGGGLYLSYDGKDAPVLLEQTMLAALRPYRITVSMEASVQPNGGQLRWALSCASGGEELGGVRVRQSTKGVETLAFDTIAPPSDCRGLRLFLAGAPGEFPLWARATVKGVSILPLPLEP